MESIAIVILAGGRGKRMRSDLPKVAFRTREKPLILHVLKTASALSPEKLVVVTGYKRELVEEVVRSGAAKEGVSLSSVQFAEQKEQKGTGDAARSALPSLEGFKGTVVILYGDAPLIRSETLQELVKIHSQEKATVTILSFIAEDPKAYGRIIRDPETQKAQKIVEAKDCSAAELLVKECNSGIYAIDSAFLAPALKSLTNNNAQGEFYLTDIVEKAAKEGQNISALIAPDPLETEGVNNLADLALVNSILLRRQREELLLSGVVMEDPESVFIDREATIAPGVVLGPNIQIKGPSVIKEGVIMEGNAYLSNTTIHEGAKLKFSVRADDAVIGKGAQIGPFAHLRPGTELADEVHIGNFVETKKAKLGKGAKANHLTYLGDCKVGARTNIGAGTITCNYDGYTKAETIIGENAFIGSDSCLIAPVTVHDGATVGAGSVITKDVEADSLAFTRSPQIAKSGWSKAKREKSSKK